MINHDVTQVILSFAMYVSRSSTPLSSLRDGQLGESCNRRRSMQLLGQKWMTLDDAFVYPDGIGKSGRAFDQNWIVILYNMNYIAHKYIQYYIWQWYYYKSISCVSKDRG